MAKGRVGVSHRVSVLKTKYLRLVCPVWGEGQVIGGRKGHGDSANASQAVDGRKNRRMGGS